MLLQPSTGELSIPKTSAVSLHCIGVLHLEELHRIHKRNNSPHIVQTRINNCSVIRCTVYFVQSSQHSYRVILAVPHRNIIGYAL